MVTETIYERIERLTLQKGVKPHKVTSFLAEACGISYQAVSKWKKGISTPDFRSLEQFAPTLGVSAIELRDGIANDELEAIKSRIIAKLNQMTPSQRRLLESIAYNEKLLDVLEAQSQKDSK